MTTAKTQAKTPEQRTRELIAASKSKEGIDSGAILNGDPRYKYFWLPSDPPGEQVWAMRELGYERCADVGDEAQKAGFHGGELWREPLEFYEYRMNEHRKAREAKARDARNRSLRLQRLLSGLE